MTAPGALPTPVGRRRQLTVDYWAEEMAAAMGWTT